MSNSILNNYEVSIIVNLMAFLHDRHCSRLADRLNRSFNYAKQGVVSREQFFHGVLLDAVFRGVYLACRERNAVLVSDFSDLLDFCHE